MNVVFGSSKEYTRYLRVLLMSLFESGSDEWYDVYLLYHDDMDDILAGMEDWIRNYPAKLHAVYIPDDIYEMTIKAMNPDSPWHPACVYRYACVELLPEDLDRVLMLGIDTVVKASIRDLYDMEMPPNKWFAMCPPAEFIYQGQSHFFEQMIRSLEKFSAHPVDQLYNTEVMLFDLKKCRGKFKYSDFTAFIAKSQLDWLDVTAISGLYQEHIEPIDGSKYNFYAPFYEKIPKDSDIRILQYINPYNKPWKYQDDSWYNQLWWDYARRAYDDAGYAQLENDRKAAEREMAASYRDMMKKISYTPPKYELYYEFFSLFEEKRMNGQLDFPLCSHKNIALYGYGTIGKLLFKTLEEAGYPVNCVISNETNGNEPVRFVLPQNIDKAVDLIIVTPIYDYYVIKKMLERYSCAKIVSAQDLLGDM